jgi:hypothetical protein
MNELLINRVLILVSHEEAHSWLISHYSQAAENGSKKCSIRTVDSDVLVLAIALFSKMGLEEL